MQGVANRDLKLENLLLHRNINQAATAADARRNQRPQLKICDFGYSKHELNSPATSGVGTPIYMAPEIIYGISRYDAKVSHTLRVGGGGLSIGLPAGGAGAVGAAAALHTGEPAHSMRRGSAGQAAREAPPCAVMLCQQPELLTA